MVEIREEEPQDVAAVRHVNELAFGEPDEADMVDALRSRGVVTLSLVAEKDGLIVGHIMFSPVTIEGPEHEFPAVALGPMAVLPEHQRQGIGTALAETGLAECRKAGHERVVVLGHVDYYPRFGFAPASRWGVVYEWGAGDEFMAIELREGALRDCEGVAKYQPEFR